MYNKQRIEMLKEAKKHGADLSPVDYQELKEYEQKCNNSGHKMGDWHMQQSGQEVRFCLNCNKFEAK